MSKINDLRKENQKLRKAARLIHARAHTQSGSKQMADIDTYCKAIGLFVWEWPLGNSWPNET
jgi:hypothetical protein